MKKRVLAIFVASMLALTMLPSCANKTATAGKTIVACLGQEPDSIDPAICQSADGSSYIIHVFEGLTKYDKNNKVVNGQAESVTVSKDGLVYTYKIRSDAKWSDGKSVTADDFIYAWQRAVNPATASQYAYQLYYIKNAMEINKQPVDKNGNPEKIKFGTDGKPVTDAKGNYTADENGKYLYAKADGSAIWLDDLGIKAIDDRTLQVTLASPCPYFGQITAFPTLFPVRKDIIEANPDKWTNDPKTYIGNGPYMLSSWVHDNKIVLKKNPNYYDSKNIVSNEIDFLLMKENSAVLAAFKNKSLDLVQSMIPPEEIQNLIKSKDCVVNPQLGINYIALNMQKSIFKDVRVRKALALAIDRTYVCESVLRNGTTPAGAFVPYNIQDATAGSDFRKVGKDYIDPSSAAVSKNVAEAQKLLAEAGYPGGKNFPTLEYKSNPGSANKNYAEYLKSAWQKNLGITVNITMEDWAVLIPDRNKGNYDLTRDAWAADYSDPMTFLDMFVANSGNNDCKYSNPEFDKLIADAKSTGDQTRRMSDMHKAEGILMNDMCAIPVSYRTDPVLVSKNLTGYFDSPVSGNMFLMWAVKK